MCQDLENAKKIVVCNVRASFTKKNETLLVFQPLFKKETWLAMRSPWLADFLESAAPFQNDQAVI